MVLELVYAPPWLETSLSIPVKSSILKWSVSISHIDTTQSFMSLYMFESSLSTINSFEELYLHDVQAVVMLCIHIKLSKTFSLNIL